MRKTLPLALAVLLASSPLVQALAQDKPQDQAPTQAQPQSPDKVPDQTQPPQGQTQAPPQGQAQDTGQPPKPIPIPGSPDLAVASVKAEGGHRVSKITGATVYNNQNQQIGTVDDIILNDENKAILAIIAVGGFLGVGSKLVAEPYGDLKFDNAKVELPDATKEQLNGMPSFTYGP